MSSASTFYDDTPPADSYDKWQRIVRQYPNVQELYLRLIRRPVDHSYDMPYVAGYNKAGTQIYIDRHLPFIVKLDGKSVCIRDFLRAHEAAEKAIKKLLRPGDHEFAHHIATGVEYHEVEEAGIKVASYKKFLRPFIKADTHEQLSRIPSDFDTSPITSAPHHPGDEALLKRVQPLITADRKRASSLFKAKDDDKVTKDSVRYQERPAANGDQCSKCSMFKPLHECTHVIGYILPDGWCKDWEAKK